MISLKWLQYLVNSFTLYSDSGGGGGSTTSTNYTSSLPEYARPYYETLLNDASGELNKPYVPNPNQTVAGFNPMQTQAQTNVSNMTTSPDYNNASQALQFGTQAALNTPISGNYGQANNIYSDSANTAQGLGVSGNYGTAANAYMNGMNSAANTQKWTDPGVAASYMNPYQQNVTDIQKREANRQSGMQSTADDAKFAQSGAFGGSRHGIVDAERNRNLSTQMNDIQSQGLNQAYQQGQSTFGADRAAAQAGIGLGYQGAQGLVNTAQQAHQDALGNINAANASAQGLVASGAQQNQDTLANINTGMQGANALSQNATAQQAAALGIANAQNTMGTQQQDLQQKQLDQQTQDFINQRDYQRQNLNFYSGLLHGVPVTAQQNVVQYSPQGSSLGQVAGLGIAGLGAYNAANK